MNILIINSGSSSIKYRVFDKKLNSLIDGVIERVGEKGSLYQNHKEALYSIKEILEKESLYPKIVAHRVVHGGSLFTEPTIITQNIINKIEAISYLAPLHNYANLEGIKIMKTILPNSTQIAFFDTAFHQNMPKLSYSYAIPDRLNIRRYGFHGISHQYLLKKTANKLDKPIKECNIITIHLGNGSSIAVIKGGKSYKTSMGFTPLEGLVMGSRCGDIDAGIIFYLVSQKKMSIDEVNHLLNKESGLKGLSGTNDMRDIIFNMNQNNSQAKFAFELFCNRIKEYIGSYMALVSDIEAIVFSGGIGANSPEVRYEVCKDLKHLGISIDREKNRDNQLQINDKKSSIKIFAFETNEEYEMALGSLNMEVF